MGFSKEFLWGAASAAYQVEGAYNEDGKGMGIWDALSEGHVRHGENGNIACDHYHRYKEDVIMMKKMGLKAYRFSVSWPRIMPEEGVVNEKGIQFYQDLVDELLKADIEPMCTLFHWNLPMWLHEKGGWGYDGISDAFAEYTGVVVKALSDKVQYWMTLNEPACFVGLGYMNGIHAPFEKHMESYEDTSGLELLVNISRNVLLSHGKAAAVIRECAVKTPQIGLALNGNLNIPEAETTEKIELAKERTFSEKRFVFSYSHWADPMILGKVPSVLAGAIDREDLKVIHQKLDFIGFNSYNSNDYADDSGERNEKVYPGMPRTAMGWPITPGALYWNIRFLHERYHIPVLITENGMANLDFVMSDGKVHDPQRIEYMKSYMVGLKRAVEDGYPVIGYMYWSVMDNFEWAEGYDKRFGLVHVDYRTQVRTMKDSAYWYAEVIRENGANIHSWQKEVDQIKERYCTDRKGEIVFYGASNFAYWKQMETDMEPYKVQNHAFGGSTDVELVRYAEQILIPYEPGIVVFQTGSNDYVFMSGSDEDKVNGCLAYKKQMFEDLHKKLPKTKFIIMSGLLLPGRSEYADMTLELNERLEAYAKDKEYLSFVNATALTYDGEVFEESLFTQDRIHLNYNGQMRWYEEYIRPALEKVIVENGWENMRTEPGINK